MVISAISTSLGSLRVDTNTALTSLLIGSSLLIYFQSNALAQSGPGSVDDILAKLDTAGFSGGSLQLQGGTSATPSPAGVTSKNNLIGKGWSVTTN